MASATTYLSSPTTTTWQLGQADKPDQRTAVQEKQYRRLRRKLHA